MSKRSDITMNRVGKKLGRLSIISYVPSSENKGRAGYLCVCDCGNKLTMRVSVVSKGAQSCGCKRNEDSSKRLKTHGLSKTLTWISWRQMTSRCCNGNSTGYERYGGRGIVVCKRWKSFENFLRDMGNRPNMHYTLERNDTNGNYCKSNCRWATYKEQANNRTNAIKITWKGKTKTLSEWAEEIGIKYTTLHYRISVMGVDRALSTCVRKYNKKGTKWKV